MLPATAVRLLMDMLVPLTERRALAVMPEKAELTTQQAADVLNLSRPHLVKVVREGTIPHHKVGTHRRVLLHDILAYRARRAVEASAAMDELAAQAQELGMG